MLPASIYILRPLTAAARTWLTDNVPEGTYAMGGVVVEPRYLDDIWEGIIDASLDGDFEVVS